MRVYQAGNNNADSCEERHSRSEDFPGNRLEQMIHVGTEKRRLYGSEDAVGRAAACRECCSGRAQELAPCEAVFVKVPPRTI